MKDTEQKIEKIEKLLKDERDSWTLKLKTLIETIGDPMKLSNAQIYMLSYRHMMIDKITDMKILLSKKKSNDANYSKIRYQYYKTNYDVRLDHKEIMEYIKSDMSLRNRESNLINSQIEHFKQMIDTLDKLGFAIKNKVTLVTNDI